MSTPTASASMTNSKPTASIAMGSAVSPTQVKPKTSALAVTSMVCGIVGLVIFGIVLGPLAIIFGAIATNRINEKPQELEGLGMAKAGIICGIIAVVLWIVILIFILGA